MIGQRVQVQEVTDVDVRLIERRLLQRVGTLLRIIRHNLENVKVTINRNVKVTINRNVKVTNNRNIKVTINRNVKVIINRNVKFIFNRNVKVSVKVNINNSFMQPRSENSYHCYHNKHPTPNLQQKQNLFQNSIHNGVLIKLVFYNQITIWPSFLGKFLDCKCVSLQSASGNS